MLLFCQVVKCPAQLRKNRKNVFEIAKRLLTFPIPWLIEGCVHQIMDYLSQATFFPLISFALAATRYSDSVSQSKIKVKTKQMASNDSWINKVPLSSSSISPQTCFQSKSSQTKIVFTRIERARISNRKPFVRKDTQTNDLFNKHKKIFSLG